MAKLRALPLVRATGMLEVDSPLRCLVDAGPWGLSRWCTQGQPALSANEPSPTFVSITDADVAHGLTSSNINLGSLPRGSRPVPLYARAR